jgi:DNA-binding HxlR family transcriptional regulator
VTTQRAAPAATRKPGYVRANSVSRAVAAVIDRWSLLILAAAFQGTKRFDDWRHGIGIASNVLAARLERLVALGCLERAAVPEGRRLEYRLTPMGADLYPTALMFWRFDRLWSPRRTMQPSSLVHTTCGSAMTPVLVCAHCRQPVRARSVRYEDGPGAGFEPAPAPRSSRRTFAPHGRGSKLQMLAGESIDTLGDRWTQQILATFFLGARRFEDIRAQCGVATNILADRLKLLVEQGMLQRRVCADDPRHHEYVLTPKGLDVYPIVLTLMKWGDRWLAGRAGPPLILYCRHCDHVLDPVAVCDQCGQALDPHEVRLPRPESVQRRASAVRKVRGS